MVIGEALHGWDDRIFIAHEEADASASLAFPHLDDGFGWAKASAIHPARFLVPPVLAPEGLMSARWACATRRDAVLRIYLKVAFAALVEVEHLGEGGASGCMERPSVCAKELRPV